MPRYEIVAVPVPRSKMPNLGFGPVAPQPTSNAAVLAWRCLVETRPKNEDEGEDKDVNTIKDKVKSKDRKRKGPDTAEQERTMEGRRYDRAGLLETFGTGNESQRHAAHSRVDQLASGTKHRRSWTSGNCTSFFFEHV
jgi:hypothetical protein